MLQSSFLHVLYGLVPPTFGALIRQDWALTWVAGAPNGQERDVIKINGQFPGPPLICDEDDDIEVTVHNHMPFNTSVHWHGMMYVCQSF